MERNKQVEAAEEAQAAFDKAKWDDANYMTTAEREKAERLKLYRTLKAHGALDVYYGMYPDERPKREREDLARTRDDGGRER